MPIPVAAWVAGLGALLLLAAAATFLAMQWDLLGATARIAVVGGVTAAAVLGGARLRRPLPIVGSVVFHLGALLLPVDALGLAIQLAAPGWVRWTAVGSTAIVALPVLAVAGRAPLLGLASLVGVPVAATGLAMIGGPPPALAVAAVGLLLVPLVSRPAPVGLVALLRSASVVLPVTAVLVALAVELLATLPTGGVSATAAAAGWLSSWQVRAVVAVVVTLTLGLRARHGDRRLVAVAIATAVLALLHLVLPEATPRAVRLWTPAFVWLAVEAAAAAVGRTATDARRLRRAATVAEVLAAPLALATLALVLGPTSAVDVDRVAGGVLVIAAGAWTVAAVRLQGEGLVSAASLGGVLAAWHLLAATVLLGGAVEVSVLVALGAAFVPGLAGWLGSRHAVANSRQVVDLAAVLLLVLAAGGLAGQSAVALLVAVVAPLAVLPLLSTVAARGMRAAGAPTAIVAGLLIVGVGLLTETGVRVAALPEGIVGLVVGVTALAVTVATAGCRPVAEAGRVLAAVAGLVTVLPAGWLLPPDGVVTAPGARSVEVLGLGPGALLPAALLAVLLLLDAVADRGAVARTGAALVLLRTVSVLVLALGLDVEVVGATLLAIGTVTALGVAVGARSLVRELVVMGAGIAVVAIPVGWVLLGDAAVLRSAALLSAGVAAVLGGLVTARPALAHTGAAIATLGSWSLLSELDSTALDLWLLPVAVQLTLAGAAARRHGEVSSWLAYVPPILLVGVPAVLERLTGGPGWHGVLAGTLGVVGVVTGGRYGLRGPLVVGAGLVVAVVAVETLTVVVSLPTWAWLTVGGIALLAAAASIERLGQTPAEAARRVASGLRDTQRR
ncbi:MAG: SCO7613 C-terminal domain-containing membrane protein [Actinomycetota bacterium]